MSILDIHIPAWTEDAACREADPSVFYPHRNASGEDAVAICRTCPVTTQCLAWALEFEATHPGSRYGVFGGTTPNQRRQLTHKNKQEKP